MVVMCTCDFQVEIESLNNESSGIEFSNFTLEPEVTSLVLFNVSSTSKYSFRVAAYTRQGIGPFRDQYYKYIFALTDSVVTNYGKTFFGLF